MLGVAAFDFCFVPPYLTFAVSDQQYVVTFVVMLVTALVISTLTHRVRRQADAARERENRTRTLLTLSRDLAAVQTTEEIVLATVRQIAAVLGTRAVVLLPDGSRRLAIKGDSAADGSLDAKDVGVAQWAFEHEQAAGRGTATLPASAGTFFPMKASRGAAGVLGLFPQGQDGPWPAEQRQMVEALASQAALAVERAALAEEARAAWERVEAEFLRNTLLSGVSHELRTPLAAITGAVTSLTEVSEELPPAERREMLDTIYAEAERMDRLITNLLDMTRLESGGLVLRKEWQPLEEVVGSTLRHLDRRLRDRDVRTVIPRDLPLVEIDGITIEQVLANLLDNAAEIHAKGKANRDHRPALGRGRDRRGGGPWTGPACRCGKAGVRQVLPSVHRRPTAGASAWAWRSVEESWRPTAVQSRPLTASAAARSSASPFPLVLARRISTPLGRRKDSQSLGGLCRSGRSSSLTFFLLAQPVRQTRGASVLSH